MAKPRKRYSDAEFRADFAQRFKQVQTMKPMSPEEEKEWAKKQKAKRGTNAADLKAAAALSKEEEDLKKMRANNEAIKKANALALGKKMLNKIRGR